METQPRPRTRTSVRPVPSLAAEPVAPPRPRTAPSAGLQSESPVSLVIPEPFNPYILPAGRTVRDWAQWGVQALVLSIVATLIWDRGASIRPEVAGQVKPFAAPAQWVSALLLGLGMFATAAAFGIPWGVLPLATGTVVLTRRFLAAAGVEMTVEAATQRLVRKAVLVVAGIAAWWGSVALADWVKSLSSTLTSNPVAKMAGEGGVAQIKTQASGAADTILSIGAFLGGGLALAAALWWAGSVIVAGRAGAEKPAVADEATA